MLPALIGTSFGGSALKHADNFSYVDPVDSSVTSRQGLRMILQDGSRVILRLSGTGTQGATIRVYLERYVSSEGNLNLNPQLALKDLIDNFNSLSEITSLTGLKEPTVIT